MNFKVRSREVPRLKAGGVLWIHYKGEVRTLELKNSKRSYQAGNVSRDEESVIIAPMPGKITKIHKSAGDSVNKGEFIVSMEAMKMEYNLEAPITGTVKEIKVKLGDQVSLGDLLADLEK